MVQMAPKHVVVTNAVTILTCTLLVIKENNKALARDSDILRLGSAGTPRLHLAITVRVVANTSSSMQPASATLSETSLAPPRFSTSSRK
jgi:hypothetical protein